jgi:Tol biopolymer transport system component
MLSSLLAGCVDSTTPVSCPTCDALPIGDLRLLVTDGCSLHPSWSPDGSEVVFDHYPGGACPWGHAETLHRVPVTGVSEWDVLRSLHIGNPSAPAWSPQGDWIAFGNYDWENPTAKGIYIIRPDGTDLTQLANEMGNPVWSPDGEWLVFAGPEGMYKVRRDGTAKLLFSSPTGGLDDCKDPSWSPDGTHLVYACKTDVYVSNADGSAVVNLTAHTPLGWVGWPAWSPCGDKILFNGGPSGGRRSIYVINPDGSELVNLTQGSHSEEHPTWSPDGQQIAFTDKTAGWLSVMDATGSNRRIVANIFCSPHYGSWSPDGEWIAFSCEYVSVGAQMPAAIWIYLVRVKPEAP